MIRLAAERREAVSTIDPVAFREALLAHERAVAFHLVDPDVTLIDVGLRIKEREESRVTDELTVRVHRRFKPRGAAFEEFAHRNPGRVVDARWIGFPVDVIEADYRLQWYWYPPYQPPLRAQVHDPLRGGISVSNEWSWGYGTLGGLVRERDGGPEMILSNWHVLVGSAYLSAGLRILQPGQGDGGRIQHTVARLTRHAMDRGIDAAVATLTGARSSVNDQLGIGGVSGVAAPWPGMQAIKSGRASGVTEGIITGVEGARIIPYGGFDRMIKHIIHIAQATGGGQVSAPGDSGSWWLEKATNKAVGLHLAGADLPEYGLAVAMPQVVDALDIELM
jgi:hypothetical protein